MHKFSIRPFILSLCLVSSFGCSTQKPHLGESVTTAKVGEGVTITESDERRLLPSGKLAGNESVLAQEQSTVEAINYKRREITLQTARGEPVTLIAGPEVVNFNQIKAGDKVNVEYLIALSFEMREPSPEEAAAAKGITMEVGARAKLGAMPAAGAAESRISVHKVEAVNKNTSVLTLRNVNTDATLDVKAKYPENLALIKVGDPVVVSTVEAVAVNVTRIP